MCQSTRFVCVDGQQKVSRMRSRLELNCSNLCVNDSVVEARALAISASPISCHQANASKLSAFFQEILGAEFSVFARKKAQLFTTNRPLLVQNNTIKLTNRPTLSYDVVMASVHRLRLVNHQHHGELKRVASFIFHRGEMSVCGPLLHVV